MKKTQRGKTAKSTTQCKTKNKVSNCIRYFATL